MDSLDGLDGDIVDVAAPRTAALSVDTTCICQPLHHNCNPNTCDRAADISIARGSYLTRRSTENISRGNDPAQIVCHRGELRDAALRGCITCAILFAGIAGSDQCPVVGNDSWPRTMKDERVNVEIKASGELVCCKLSSSSQSSRNFKHPINLAFYASHDSSTSPLSFLRYHYSLYRARVSHRWLSEQGLRWWSSMIRIPQLEGVSRSDQHITS